MADNGRTQTYYLDNLSVPRYTFLYGTQTYYLYDLSVPQYTFVWYVSYVCLCPMSTPDNDRGTKNIEALH